MNSFIKSVGTYFCSTWEYKTILLYLIIGLLFTASQAYGTSYLEMLMNTFTNKIFLTVVLYPSFIAMFLVIYKYLARNYELLLRFGDRFTYAKVCILTIIFMTFFLYIQAILITIICCNITQHQAFRITNKLGYEVNDLIIFLIACFKIILTALGTGFLTLLLFFKPIRKNIMVIVLMSILTILFFSDKWYPSKISILNIFNPGFQSHGYALTTDLLFLIYSGIIYFTVIFLSLFFLIYRSCKKVQIGVEKK